MARLKEILPASPQLLASPETSTSSKSEPGRNSKVKLSRTSTRKVRTGCITCKRRHIKCDEAKPHCGNCLQSRGHCEGYLVAPKKTSGPAQICWDSKHVIRQAPSPATQARLDANARDFRDDAGLNYFQEFVGLLRGPWMSAASSGDLWVVTLPQLARNNGTLRSAAMAIGALSVWYRQSASGSLRAVTMPDQPTCEGDAHYFRAVAHYCDSLRAQRRRSSVQDAVFLSVLLLFFESLRGNRKAALDHVNHALSLLLAIMTDADAQLHLSDLAPNPRPVIGTVADVFNQLARQARAVFRGRILDGPPLPNLQRGLRSSKQTMESFMILLSQMRSDYDIGSSVPPVFSSLDEFEQTWPILRRHQAAMSAIMEDAIQKSGIYGSHDDAAITKFHLDLLGNPHIKEYCTHFQESMDKLHAAFQPLFKEIISSDIGSPTYLRAILLRLEFLEVYTTSNATNFIEADSVASLSPLFREYLSLGHIALRTTNNEVRRNPAHNLSLQRGLAWYLLIVSLFSRDPVIRDEAVWMLRDYPGQDGLWNTRALYALALRNRHIERVNAVEGTPEEQWRRLWRREFLFEDGGDRVVLRYLVKDESTGAWHLVEELAEIQGEGDAVQWTPRPITGHGGLLVIDLYTAWKDMELVMPTWKDAGVEA
ncbi:putative transcriptional regulatory protein [Colletotrichum spaethianum]|uniref:Transcriptional regulatory protein n=1 Tax=Colletotrichum spaethianum TaxID=700344 RepID=A0AA37NZE8_9PEZI|nr:putative transcriptional regulatory protein [Colletotrichum spaethianum]GKT47242.1 putative transcriptional regulatory protein [Colletotrichum spaethianum]